MSELEFKKALAREYGIHEEGRKTEEGKLLGATPGNIYSEYVINGSEEIEELPKDDVSSMPSDAEVVSDKTNTHITLAHTGESSRTKEENDNIGRKLQQKKMKQSEKKNDDKKRFEKEFLSKMFEETIKKYNKLSKKEKEDASKKILDLFYDGVSQGNKIKDFKLDEELNKIMENPKYKPAAFFEYVLTLEEIRQLSEDYIYNMHLDDGRDNINKKPREKPDNFYVSTLKKLIFENEKIEPKYQKLILGDTIIINDKKLKVSSIEDKKNGYQAVVLTPEIDPTVNYFIARGSDQKMDWAVNLFVLPYRNKIPFLNQPKDASEQIKPFVKSGNKIVIGSHSLAGAISMKVANDYDNVSAIIFDPASNNTETGNVGSRVVTILPKGGGILGVPNAIIDNLKKNTELNQKIPLNMYPDILKYFVIKNEEKEIDELNKEKIIYENNTNQMIENKKIYKKMYNKFENEYLKKEAIEFFEDIMSYPASYKNYKAGIIIKNIDELLKDEQKKNKEKIVDELLNILEMKQGIFRKHNSGSFDNDFNNQLIKKHEYERIYK